MPIISSYYVFSSTAKKHSHRAWQPVNEKAVISHLTS